MNEIAIVLSGLTALNGVIVAFAAYRQWVIARNKLAIDLFDRRLAAYDRVNIAIEATKDWIAKSEDPSAVIDVPPFAEIWRSERALAFLFGANVIQLLKPILDGLRQLAMAKHNALACQGAVPTEKSYAAYEAYIAAYRQVDSAQIDLIEACKPYMYLGEIGVSRPLNWTVWKKRPTSTHSNPRRTG